MKRFALIAVMVLGGCAQTSVPGLQLVGKYANPASTILQGLCQQQCVANACLDYNLISAACVNGLPVQGLAGAEALKMFCTANAYETTTTPVPIAIPLSCLTPAAVKATQAQG